VVLPPFAGSDAIMVKCLNCEVDDICEVDDENERRSLVIPFLSSLSIIPITPITVHPDCITTPFA
jgi:hypothetical protein